MNKKTSANKRKSAKHRYQIQGTVLPGFEPVRDEFERGFKKGIEVNAQLCIYVDQECVVDLYGVMLRENSEEKDPDRNYNSDSIQNVFSSSKSLTAIVFATLVDRGLVSYEDKVAKHWPEFAQNGKADIRICDVLRHECGMVYLDETIMFRDMYPDRLKENTIGRVIENKTPNFPPSDFGSQREYHGLTRGWILNEVFRRVDPQKRTVGEYLREEISGPLKIDAYIGVTDEEMPKMATLKAWTVRKAVVESCKPNAMGGRIDPNLFDMYALMKRLKGKKKETALKRPPAIEGMDKVRPNKFVPMFNREVIQRGETPSGNSCCSARALAKLGCCILNGGSIDGVKVLSSETVEEMHAGLEKAVDYAMNMRTEFSKGGINLYRTYEDDTSKEKREKSLRENFYGWMGFGGSVFQWNRDLKISFAYAPTMMCWYDLQNVRGARIQSSVVECVKLKGQEQN